LRVAELVQFASVVHWTHSMVAVLHAGLPPPPPRHWVSLVQAIAQRFVAGLQTRPASPQFALVRHSTQVPVGEQ
jgi:hypothetical protein